MSSKVINEIKPRRYHSKLPPIDGKKAKSKSCTSLVQRKPQASKLSISKLVIERSPLDTPTKEEKQMELWMDFRKKRSEIVFLNALMKMNYEQEGV
jgi:hypothetical protein